MPGWRRGGPRTSGRGRALVQSRPPERRRRKVSGRQSQSPRVWKTVASTCGSGRTGVGSKGGAPSASPKLRGLGEKATPLPGVSGWDCATERAECGAVRPGRVWGLRKKHFWLRIQGPSELKKQIICSENVNSSTKLFGGCESGYSQRPLPRAGGPPRPLRGPNFRGAEPSAELALRGWLETLERTLKVPWS